MKTYSLDKTGGDFGRLLSKYGLTDLKIVEDIYRSLGRFNGTL